MPPKTKTATASPTTSQSLGNLLKSARDIMRKDKGLNGDLDRLPLLTWIMFLKFLDDLETQRELGARLSGKKFRAAIEEPYRWRDWAANQQGVTGDELLAFINQDEAVRPDGSRGAGLFAYLRGLTSANGDDRREVIAMVFKGVDNRMRSGYLLRDVINKVAEIHFTATDELHTLGALYESMLREMRDAAGDSGEFYTPRPVVRFMVEVVDPQLGESILDPAAGTGGFLVEGFSHLSRQIQTVEERRVLQEESLFGCEPKPLPFLLCQMNLLLHGLDAPEIDPNNALRFKLSEIGERDRVDVILTNPPFGGEEEKGIQGNFPEDRQTAETALLFLQLVMRRLRQGSKTGGRFSRAAVIVPDGTLFNEGVARRIREDLLARFNLHTIVRLPFGVFAPYAKSVKTNILFFDSSGPTNDIWFYEHQVPGDRKNYSKTKPIEYEDFDTLRTWLADRQTTDQAWHVGIDAVRENGFGLDFKNPNELEQLFHQPPEILITRVESNLIGIQEKISELQGHLAVGQTFTGDPTSIGEFAELVKRSWLPEPGTTVKGLGVKWWGKGAYVAETKPVESLQADRFLVCGGDLIYNDMWARHGSVAIVPDELDGCVASAHFPTWELDADRVYGPYLSWCFRTPWFWAECERRSRGSTGRNAIRKSLFKQIRVQLPSKDQQIEIAAALTAQAKRIADMTAANLEVSKELEALTPSVLDILLPAPPKTA